MLKTKVFKYLDKHRIVRLTTKYCCLYDNSVDLIRCCILQHLIWVYTVCKGLSVPILRVINACPAEAGHTLSVNGVDPDQLASEEAN